MRKPIKKNTKYIYFIIPIIMFSTLIIGFSLSKDTVKNYYNKSQKNYENNNYKYALEYINKAINKKTETYNKTYKLYTMKGLILLEFELYEEAQKMFKKSLELRSYNETFFGLGILKNKKENYQEAIRLFTKAININPELGHYYLHRGYSRYDYALQLEDKEQYKKSIDFLNKAGEDFVKASSIFNRNGKVNKSRHASEYNKLVADEIYLMTMKKEIDEIYK